MNDTVQMSVYSMTCHGDEKAIYVFFSDDEKTAEFMIPGCKLLNSSGFDDGELRQLEVMAEKLNTGIMHKIHLR